MKNRIKNYFLKQDNLRDILRNQEIIIENLLSSFREKREEFDLFNYIVKNQKISNSRNYSDLVALFYLGNNRKLVLASQ